MAEINWTELNPPERSRAYTFPDKTRLYFHDVSRIEVRESGKHRLEYGGGKKAFVAPGWICLEIDTDEWTF